MSSKESLKKAVVAGSKEEERAKRDKESKRRLAEMQRKKQAQKEKVRKKRNSLRSFSLFAVLTHSD